MANPRDFRRFESRPGPAPAPATEPLRQPARRPTPIRGRRVRGQFLPGGIAADPAGREPDTPARDALLVSVMTPYFERGDGSGRLQRAAGAGQGFDYRQQAAIERTAREWVQRASQAAGLPGHSWPGHPAVS